MTSQNKPLIKRTSSAIEKIDLVKKTADEPRQAQERALAGPFDHGDIADRLAVLIWDCDKHRGQVKDKPIDKISPREREACSACDELGEEIDSVINRMASLASLLDIEKSQRGEKQS